MQHSRGMLGSALLILACMMQLACAQMPIPPANSECLRRAYDRPQKARPLVRLPKRGKEVVLTFDGGDMRAVMQAAQLCHMEEEIKAQLIAKKKVAWKNPDDFDILIADYVDLMAATSAGTYTMTYLLTTGADIHTEWPQFMTATPGSALGVYQYIWTLGYLLNQSNYNLGSNFSVVGPANAIFLDGFFKRSFGTRTLRSFDSIKSGGLWAWTIAPGQSTLTPLSDPKRKMSGVWQNYLNGSAFPHEGQDFYLWQAVRGSTSWPQRVPPLIATTTPESEQQATYAIQDGAITAMEPANVALPHLFLAANLTIDRVAMLSIGTNAVVNYDVNADWIARTITGPAAVGTAWGASLANRFRTQAVVRAIFQATKSEQNYLRIDNDYTGGATPFCNHLFEGADCARVVAAVSNTNFGNIQTYAWIGEVQAQAYAKQLKRWVKRWVV